MPVFHRLSLHKNQRGGEFLQIEIFTQGGEPGARLVYQGRI